MPGKRGARGRYKANKPQKAEPPKERSELFDMDSLGVEFKGFKKNFELTPSGLADIDLATNPHEYVDLIGSEDEGSDNSASEGESIQGRIMDTKDGIDPPMGDVFAMDPPSDSTVQTPHYMMMQGDSAVLNLLKRNHAIKDFKITKAGIRYQFQYKASRKSEIASEQTSEIDSSPTPVWSPSRQFRSTASTLAARELLIPTPVAGISESSSTRETEFIVVPESAMCIQAFGGTILLSLNKLRTTQSEVTEVLKESRHLDWYQKMNRTDSERLI